MGKEVPENIHLAARADGVLVKPDRPMVPTDDTYLREAHGERGALTAWTCTDHNDHRTLYVFAFAPGRSSFDSADFPWEIAPGTYGIGSAAYAYDVTHKESVLVAARQRYRGALEGHPYGMVIIAPIGPSGIAFLGDEDKIASTGKQRIADIHESAASLKVTVLAAPGEAVVNLHGFAEAAPRCSIADGKPLPVRYDAVTKLFSVAVPMPAAGGQQFVTFLGMGR
jgi:hypothetical protein